jgi:hypothetical protein
MMIKIIVIIIIITIIIGSRIIFLSLSLHLIRFIYLGNNNIIVSS